jgi:hypothetical protein
MLPGPQKALAGGGKMTNDNWMYLSIPEFIRQYGENYNPPENFPHYDYDSEIYFKDIEEFWEYWTNQFNEAMEEYYYRDYNPDNLGQEINQFVDNRF